MAKFFGYFIGAIFVVGLVLGPISGTVYFLHDLISAFDQVTESEAIVEKCISKRSSTGRAVARGVPVAKTSDGISIEGSIGQPKIFLKCEDMIGSNVPVLLHPTDTSKNRISTFWQLWFLPTILTFVSIVWYYALIVGYQKKRQKKL